MRGAYMPGVPPFSLPLGSQVSWRPPRISMLRVNLAGRLPSPPLPLPWHQHSHATILDMATGSISFNSGQLTQLPHHLLIQDKCWGRWAGNRLPGVPNARKRELLLGFLKVASSYTLSLTVGSEMWAHTSLGKLWAPSQDVVPATSPSPRYTCPGLRGSCVSTPGAQDLKAVI